MRNLFNGVNLSFAAAVTVVILLCSGCLGVKQETAATNKVSQQPGPAASAPKLELTPKEQAYLAQLKAKGGLVVASRKKETVYQILANGDITGFHYNLVKDFAQMTGLSLTVKNVLMENYFTKGGILPSDLETNPSISYDPDLIDQVDMYVDTLTITPWRAKLIKFVKLFPVKQMFITRKGEELQEISAQALNSKRIVIQPRTSYADAIYDLEKKVNGKFNYVEVADTDYMAQYVAAGNADVTTQDSHRCFEIIKKYPNLSVSQPFTDLEYIAWAVKRDNELLAGIINKYLVYAQQSGRFDQYWRLQYQVGYLDYLRLIGI